MTQDEKWQIQYDQMMEFMETNHRRPKHTKKMIAKGGYPPDRLEKFAKLLEVASKYRRKNQYQ